MGELVHDRYHAVPLDELTTPATGQYTIYADYFWFVDDQYRVLFYQGRYPQMTAPKWAMPQCNKDQRILERRKDLLDLGYKIKQVETVYVPFNVGEYV